MPPEMQPMPQMQPGQQMPQVAPVPTLPDQPPKHHHYVLVALIVVSLLFIGAVIFGVWAFMGRQDYKNNVDQKINTAVATAKQQQNATDTVANNEANKSPLKTYKGPSDYGSVVIKYPKTWSAYVDTSDPSNPVNGYFQPDYVPSTNNGNSNNFALRIMVLNQPYDQIVSSYQQQVQQGGIKITSYKPVNVPSDPGVMVSGAIEQNKQGVMIILPLRANTLELWTESDTHDFAKYILPNFSFSP